MRVSPILDDVVSLAGCGPFPPKTYGASAPLFGPQMKIYIVQGATGEYSDFREWVVCAFKDEQKAIDLVEAATERARTIFALYKASSYRYKVYKTNDFDPEMEMDYTGTRYEVIETELLES